MASYSQWDGTSAFPLGEWTLDGIAANLGAAKMAAFKSVKLRSLPTVTTIVRFVLQADGNAVGGNLTAEIYVNGTASGTQAVLEAGNSQVTVQCQVSVNEVDDVEIRVSTPVTWLSLTMNLLATVWGI